MLAAIIGLRHRGARKGIGLCEISSSQEILLKQQQKWEGKSKQKTGIQNLDNQTAGN